MSYNYNLSKLQEQQEKMYTKVMKIYTVVMYYQGTILHTTHKTQQYLHDEKMKVKYNKTI